MSPGGGGHLPNFCMQVCQSGLRNGTLSMTIFWKQHAVLLAIFAEIYPFLNKIAEYDNSNCCRVIHSLHKNTSLFLPFCLICIPFLLHFNE